MKTLLILLIAGITIGNSNKALAQVYTKFNFNTFYTELSPYGKWVNDNQYGQVWIASQRGFEPYYDNGHWVFTSYGWTWVSDFSWGWAPFHYGRWAYLPTWGWAWVPGYEWAPAWVGWCQNDGYYGWAPLSPGMGTNFNFYNIPIQHWRFVQQQYIIEPAVSKHIIRPERNKEMNKNITLISNTQVNNTVTYQAGPNREGVEKITRQPIASRQVDFTDKKVPSLQSDNKALSIYRPGYNQLQSGVTEKQDKETVRQMFPPKNAGENIPGRKPSVNAAPLFDQPIREREQQVNTRALSPKEQVNTESINTEREQTLQQQRAQQELQQTVQRRREEMQLQQQRNEGLQQRQQQVEQRRQQQVEQQQESQPRQEMFRQQKMKDQYTRDPKQFPVKQPPTKKSNEKELQ